MAQKIRIRLKAFDPAVIDQTAADIVRTAQKTAYEMLRSLVGSEMCIRDRGTEMVMPGDNTAMEIELIAPIAMDEGLRFAIREGGRTVGAGVVAGIIQ